MVVDTLVEILQVGLLALITVSYVVAVFFVWRDDHRWVDERHL